MKSSLLADDSAAGLPAVAQPVAQLAASPQPAALPVAVMTGVSVSSTVGVADTHHIQAPQLVQAHAQHLGHFSSGLCDCCTDCNICCTTWCCPFIGIGQLAQRYSPLKANGTKAYKCKVVAVVLGFAMLLNYILSYVARTQYMDDIRTLVYACSPDVSVYHQRAVNNPELCQAGFSIFSNMMAVTSISGLISAFIFFASCFTIMTIRSKIRKAQRIAPTCCDDGCDDCCVACFCTPFEQCRLIRHTLACTHNVGIGGQPIPATYEFCNEEGTSAAAPPELQHVPGMPAHVHMQQVVQPF